MNPATDIIGSDRLSLFINEHRLFVLVLSSYFWVAFVILSLANRPYRFVLMYPLFALIWGGLTAAWLAWRYLMHPRLLRASLEPSRALGALLVFFVAVPAQSTFQSVKKAIGPAVGFSWDPALDQLDQLVHGGPAWMWFSSVVESPLALRAIDWLYTIWFILLLLFIWWVSWTTRRQLRQQAMVAFLLIWIIGGNIIAAVFASAGPCYSSHVGVDPAPYAALLARTQASHLFAATAQPAIWQALVEGPGLTFGGVSAFPSIHVAVAVFLAIVGWKSSRWVGIVMAVYASLIQVGSIVLGWHYAVDGYAGAIIAFASWHLAGWMTRRFGQPLLVASV